MLAGSWVATRELNIPPQYELNDKLIHMIVFFGFAVLVDLSSLRKPFWFWKGLPLLVYGMCIEIMQYFTSERNFSMLDWGADLTGVLLYFLAKKFFTWLDLKGTSIF
jgi:VanZ family protein